MTTQTVKAPAKASVSMKGFEKIVGCPTAAWEGNCFFVASKLAAHFGGTAVYGHWHGEVSTKGWWSHRAGQGFYNHGWIVLPDERGKYRPGQETIVDPTRWSFEAKKPYIWRGKNDGTYDEGGNRFRMAMRGDEPPEDDGKREPLTLELSCDEAYDAVKRVCGYGEFHDFDTSYPFINHADARWLANTAPTVIGLFFVAEIYEALDRAGLHAAIPTDNWRMVDRYFGLKTSTDKDEE